VIPLLAPIFRGEWARYGETLLHGTAASPLDLNLAELVGKEAIREQLLQAYGSAIRCNDQQATASLFMLHYFEMLLPPAVAVLTLLKHVFPLTLDRTWLRLDAKGQLSAIVIADLGEARLEASTHELYSQLLWVHLEPLILAFAKSGGLASSVLWSHASRRMAPIFDTFITQGAQALVGKDLDALLRQQSWPGKTKNPLYRHARTAERVIAGQKKTIRLHNHCCLYYRVAPYNYCTACPIDAWHR